MLTRTVLLASLALAAGVGLQAQGPRGRFHGPEGIMMQDAAPGGFRFLGAEAGPPGRVVTGSPYSADIVTDTTQTLPDGNRIHRTLTSHVYRDSQGRTRREQSLGGLGALAPNATNLPQVVFINDPVAGVDYALDANRHTATQTRAPRRRGPGPNAQAGTNQQDHRAVARDGQPRRDAANNPNRKVESLGTQVIEGVSAEGTRTTLTIPAGQIGNTLPIQVVSERWYSPDLQTVVLYKHSDPRAGDTVYRLSNINRSEPSASLFQVPSDYKVNQGGPRGMGLRRRPNPNSNPSPSGNTQ
ncbi:MAG TPA: hypothetical protein VG675_24315 [Bryobacteraceae bacterium]|nr:hypothetical protein [Bryobacteraceae bacterium]